MNAPQSSIAVVLSRRKSGWFQWRLRDMVTGEIIPFEGYIAKSEKLARAAASKRALELSETLTTAQKLMKAVRKTQPAVPMKRQMQVIV